MRSRVVGVVLSLAVGATACATTSAGGAAVASSSSSLPGSVSSSGTMSQPPPVAGSPTGPTAARSYTAPASNSALPTGCIHDTLHIVHHLNSGHQQTLCMSVGSVLEVDMPKESHGPWAPVTITPTAGISVTSDLDSQQTLHVVARANASGSYTLNTVTADGPTWSGPNTSWMLTITVQH